MGAAHMQLTHDTKAGLPNTYNALVYVTFCVGSYLFTMGCFLMTVPVINEASSSHPCLAQQYMATPLEAAASTGALGS